jgi:hypothetical protein
MPASVVEVLQAGAAYLDQSADSFGSSPQALGAWAATVR